MVLQCINLTASERLRQTLNNKAGRSNVLGLVWFGLVWFGLVWLGLAWFGLVWFCLVWFGLVWLGLVWFGLVWFGLVWLGLVWLGLAYLQQVPTGGVVFGGNQAQKLEQRRGDLRVF